MGSIFKEIYNWENLVFEEARVYAVSAAGCLVVTNERGILEEVILGPGPFRPAPRARASGPEERAGSEF